MLIWFTLFLQEVKPLLLIAHEALLAAIDLLNFVGKLNGDFGSSMKCGVEESFIELGRVWQAPMYEITLNFNQCNKSENLTIVQKFLITLIDSSLCTTQLCSFFSTFVNGFSLASLMKLFVQLSMSFRLLNHLLLLSQVLLLINFVNQECFLYSITWSQMRLVMM